MTEDILKTNNVLEFKLRHVLGLYYLILALFIPSISHAAGPSLRFNRLTMDDGLSNNKITSIIQDNTGFLWIATRDGLNRFDGYSFKVFRPDPGDPNSISSHVIYDLHQDKQGIIWIATYDGLSRFDPDTEQFEHYRHNDNDPNSLSENKVMVIHEDRQGMLWLGTRGGGLDRFDPKTRSFRHYQHNDKDPHSLSGDDIRTIIEDDKGILWIGTSDAGLNRFDQQTGCFKHYRHDENDPDSLSQNSISKLYQDQLGIIWIGTYDKGLSRFNPQTGHFKHFRYAPNDPYKLETNFVMSILEDQSGVLRVGTFGGGLNRFEPQTNRFYSDRYDQDNPYSLSNNIVTEIYQDRQGVLWVGTDNGLNRFDPQTSLFNHYQHDNNDPNSLGSNDVRTIYESSQGELWVGTYGGLNRFNPQTNHFHTYQHHPDNSQSLSTNHVQTLIEDRYGILWVGTFAQGLNRFDPTTGRFQQYQHDENNVDSLSHTIVSTLLEDKQGTLWVGTLGGINRFVPSRQKFIRFQHELTNPNSLAHNYVSVLYQDRQGIFWIGLRDEGLNRFDYSTQQFVHYRHDSTNPYSLSNNSVTAIYEDQQGFLWIGTQGGGLNKFDRSQQRFIHYRKSDGLANDVVQGILEDEQNNLWISTNEGISKFNPKTKIFKNYTAEDGLQGNQFNQGAFFKNKSGELFFGGNNGFNRFLPEQIIDSRSPPDLAFTDFLIFNQSVPIVSANKIPAPDPTTKQNIPTIKNAMVLSRAIHATKKLTLTHDQSLFSFEFAALHFASPSKNQYAYKLEGWDENWIFTSHKNRIATYTNILPGEYTLRVKAANKDNVWNEKGINMVIIILPPWWLTLEMKLLYGVLSIILLAFIFYRLTVVPTKRTALLEIQVKERTAEIERKSDYIQQLLNLNTQFTQNISHSLKTPLSLILGPIERMIDDRQTSPSALLRVKRNALRLQKDVDFLVAFSIISGTAPAPKSIDNISAIADELVEDFRDAFMQKQLSLTLKTESALSVYAEPDAVARILVNLLENALKYTPVGGRVSLLIRRLNKQIELRVSDTGVGISTENQQIIFERGIRLNPTQNQPGTGIGLTFVKEILQRNSGTIEVTSKPGNGATFVVRLPASEASMIKTCKTKNGVSANIKNLVSNITTLAHIQENTKPSITMNVDWEQEGKPGILVVEDDADMRAFIVESFTDSYICLEAKDGEEGLFMARIHHPDLIISDVMMPNKNGHQMLQELKADPKVSHIPVILITAAGDPISQSQSIATGAIHYFSKPFGEQDLQQAVNTALDIQAFANGKIEKYLIDNIPVCLSEFPYVGLSDITLLNTFRSHIHKHYADPEFTNPIKVLADQVYMEQRRLRRKLSAFLNHTPATVLRNLRLQQGRTLLKKGIKPVKIYMQVGFSSQDYFGRCFREKYGQSPTEYQKNSWGKFDLSASPQKPVKFT